MGNVTTLLLVHGGLWDDMNAERFWHEPGIVAGLEERGFTVLAPDRLPRARSWLAEVEHLVPLLPPGPVCVVAGSNGCSVAVRLALTCPDRVDRLVLAWPATVGEPVVDVRARRELTELGASPRIAKDLLSGEVLRGVTEGELTGMKLPVGVLPSTPENPVHRRRTSVALCSLLPHPSELPGTPEPVRRDFRPYLGSFLTSVTSFVSEVP